jgi:serine/threonine-protein kinase RsbT
MWNEVWRYSEGAGLDVRKDETFELRQTEDIVRVRQTARAWAVELGFSLVDQTKIVTATSELARNTIEHGRGGSVRLRSIVNGARRGLRLDFVDTGPGIPNMELALRDGYTTGTGLGLGLSGSRRLMSEFEIKSEVGKGTHVSVTRWT